MTCICFPASYFRQDAYFYSGQAVRVFGVAIALLVVLVETEWRRVLQLVPLLYAWLGRGVLQVRGLAGGGEGGGLVLGSCGGGPAKHTLECASAGLHGRR